jgi:hypothetical protein
MIWPYKTYRLNLAQTITLFALAGFLLIYFSQKIIKHQNHSSALDEQIQTLQKQNTQLHNELNSQTQQWRVIHTLNQMTSGKMALVHQKALSEKILPLAKNYNLDPILILSIVYVESRGKLVTSNKGAKGMMQIQTRTAKVIATRLGYHPKEKFHLNDPAVNIELGTLYFITLLKQYKNINIALAAYNRGESYVNNALEHNHKIPLGYAHEVIQTYNRFLRDLKI